MEKTILWSIRCSKGDVALSFVQGKSRIAPKFKGHIPQATIPKLELNSAALLVKLITKIRDCIDIEISSVTFWSDSQAVLSCIASTNRKFPVYWANRLAVILNSSSHVQWMYVPSDLNPADIGSRGVTYKTFWKKMTLWLEGPAFLLCDSEFWPEQPQVRVMENVFAVTDVGAL